jgi:hypothetical protein
MGNEIARELLVRDVGDGSLRKRASEEDKLEDAFQRFSGVQ